VEPFFLRCETCQARLRVRDERFVGQVQSCPKCGSMVHILAPPVEAAAAPERVAASAAATTVSVRLLAAWRDHTLLWITSAAAASAVGALALVFALRGGDEEVAALTPTVPTVAENIVAPVEAATEELPPADEEVPNEPTTETPLPTPTPPPQVQENSIAAVPAEAEPLAAAQPPTEDVPAVIHEKPRTLKLEPLREEPRVAAANVGTSSDPEYSSASIAVAGVADAKPPAVRPPVRVTNVADRLAVPIESIELPAMPIGEFVNLISGMAAVPIQLDAKVLGEVGLSSRSTVTVQSENTTVGKLLARVLKEHQLTCVVRDGALVVVRSKQ
jgi:hypothetical protein